MLESGAGGPVDTKEACSNYGKFARARSESGGKAARWDGGARMVSEILEKEEEQGDAEGDAFAYRRHHLFLQN